VPTSLLWCRRDLRLGDHPALPVVDHAHERRVSLDRYEQVRAGA
jgi:deoxyribodipyrimidine photolyase